MRLAYDGQADALSLAFRDGEPQGSRELAPGLIVTIDQQGNAIAVILLEARAKLGKDALAQIKIDLQQL